MRLKHIPQKFKKNITVEELEKFQFQNPDLWEKIKKRFDIGRQIVQVQLLNGLDKLNENTLRNYLSEYASRFLQLGPNSFPISFNVLEPFFLYNPENSVLQMLDEEESYGLSLLDFLDFVTSKDFDLNNIDFYENIPENIIYHFNFTSSLDEINFSNTKGKTFYISSLSLVRQGNEVSLIMQAGESYDKLDAEEYFRDKTNKSVAAMISPAKKALGLRLENEEEQPKVVHLEDRGDLWLNSVAMLFDIDTKSIDIRHVARDENISYKIFTDDFFALFAGQDHLSEKEVRKYFENYLHELSSYDAVFDFAKYCLALPLYIFENEDKIVDVTYETSLNKIIKGLSSRKKYSSVPSKYKIFARPFYYLESKSQAVINKKELDDDSFRVDTSGYWKRIEIDEEGFDKKGNKILGKTWVERTDVYYTAPVGVTKIEEVKLFSSKNAGYIYIMRQPAHQEDIFKVGLTTRDAEIRSKELSNTSTIDKFFILNKYYTKDCILAEKKIHEQLEKYRLSKRREFFKCDLRIILDVCEEVVKEINQQ